MSESSLVVYVLASVALNACACTLCCDSWMSKLSVFYGCALLALNVYVELLECLSMNVGGTLELAFDVKLK